MKGINCTVDELAEALAMLGAYKDSPNDSAAWIAAYLEADRIPEPKKPDDDDWIYD